MWTAVVLCLSAAVLVSPQRHSIGGHDRDREDETPTPRPGDTATTSPPLCAEDSFALFARRCQVECLQVLNSSTGCRQCNRTCNSLLEERRRQCPARELCTLGCILSRNEEGCRICECEDDEPALGGLNPCILNATGFATRHRCRESCVRRRDDGCFRCDTDCNAEERQLDQDDDDDCGDDGDECGEGRICILEGIVNRCIEMPRLGEECERPNLVGSILGAISGEDEEEDDTINTVVSHIAGAVDRLLPFSLSVSAEIDVPCSDTFSRCSSLGTCQEVTGPCTESEEGRNGTAQCSNDGNFEALQCRKNGDGTGTCRCVFPRNGNTVPGTIVTGITEMEEIPDCESRVFGVCSYIQDGYNFIVRHGETFVDRFSCTKCRCNDGNTTSCREDSRLSCRILNPGASPRSCTRGNRKFEHGTRRKVGRCNMCGCSNGRLTCTDIDGCRDRDEEQDEDERKCERCQDTPMSLVCGRDGRTYHSRCIAMNCSGLGEDDIIDGPCSNQPVCSLFPCQEGLSCIPLGGRSCLRRNGCTADERRVCVNRTTLRCRVSNPSRSGANLIAENEDMVCGSDRQTYRSFCHMIQQAPPNTRVVHAGRCDREECNGGQACGTDGVTYDSTCHLRALSANAQVDYMGECFSGNGSSSLREICKQVRRRERKCENDENTCKHRVLSRDGCCPICGGITTLAIDKDALEEYTQATGSDTNLDEFMARMTRDDVIPDEVRRRCNLEVSHVRNSTETNIEVKMIAKNRRTDSDFCHNSSKMFAETINSASVTNSTDTMATTTTLPVEASFARAAAVAPLIETDTNEGGDSNSAAYIIASYVYLCLGLLGVLLVTV